MDTYIAAKCLACDPHGVGTIVSRQGKDKRERVATYYGAMFTEKKWRNRPRCPNCEGALSFLYEVHCDER